jgi:hypothetical protein
MPCFSIYFSTRHPKMLHNLLKNPCMSEVKSNIKLNISIYLLRTLHLKNQRLASNWSISWSFRLTHWISMSSCWLNGLQNQEACGLKERLIACYQWRNDWCRMSPHELYFGHTNLRAPIKLLRHCAFSFLGTPSSAEPSFEKRCSNARSNQPSLTASVTSCSRCFSHETIRIWQHNSIMP